MLGSILKARCGRERGLLPSACSALVHQAVRNTIWLLYCFPEGRVVGGSQEESAIFFHCSDRVLSAATEKPLVFWMVVI